MYSVSLDPHPSQSKILKPKLELVKQAGRQAVAAVNIKNCTYNNKLGLGTNRRQIHTDTETPHHNRNIVVITRPTRSSLPS